MRTRALVVAACPPAPPRAGERRAPAAALNVLLVLAGVLVLLGLALRAGGLMPLVERTDSMRPALAAGDLLLDRGVDAGTLVPGQIATIPDPGLGGRLVTHRVRSVSRRGDRVTIVTRGDANAAGERWTFAADTQVQRVVLRVPRAGHAVVWLGSAALRSVLMLLAAAALAVHGVRTLRAGR